MFKRCLSFLLIALLLCGSTSQPAWAAEAPTQEVTPSSTEPTIGEPTINDGMPHGLILVAQNKRRSVQNLDTVVQVYVIDPVTGTQTLWSQFARPNPNIQIGHTLYGNTRSQLSRDYTKLAASYPEARTGEFGQPVSHAGWINQNGEFFDVSVALGLDDTGTIGFSETDDYFYFKTHDKTRLPNGRLAVDIVICRGTVEEIQNGKYHRFAVGDDKISYHENYLDYTYNKDLFGGIELIYSGAYVSWELPATDYAEPSKNIFIADYHPHPDFPYFPIKGSTSVLFDSTTGTLVHYLPDGYNTDGKSEWGGVLSPDGTTVAYLTAPGTSGNISLEFVDISQFFASGFNPAMRGVPAKMELADGPIKQNTWHVFDYICEEPSCILLDWRE